ncbi:hypothetical protein COV15_02610 [Candidatus Woesearchaeota archaeon CG10_big_fil_rev_8_21_14_0_10_34_12]|nr:MAG: hypothetical protein COV15_02610 [Candidatus Woesearchaeota archaeon CG10_big_fil_rev_8_21_14_0_10_34_12]
MYFSLKNKKGKAEMRRFRKSSSKHDVNIIHQPVTLMKNKKGKAESSTILWAFVTLVIVIFLLGVIVAVTFLTAGKNLQKVFFRGDESGFSDLRGFGIAENFLNQEIDGMKVSDFIVYSANKGDLGRIGKEDLRDESEVNRDYRNFEQEMKKVLEKMPKPAEVSAWSVIIRSEILGINKVVRSKGSVYAEGDSVQANEKFYDSKIYLNERLSVELYLECQEVFCKNL